MICIDEFGPVEVRPQAGSAWAPSTKPIRHRATYRRTQGVRHFFAAYDVYDDKLWMRPKPRKRTREALAFIQSIRRRYPDGRRIYLVLDNLSTHRHASVREWCRGNRITLVFTATNASWMNRIECHFAPFRKFVIDNSDYHNHREIAKAAQDYLRWRNRNAQDKKILKEQNSIRTL